MSKSTVEIGKISWMWTGEKARKIREIYQQKRPPAGNSGHRNCSTLVLPEPDPHVLAPLPPWSRLFPTYSASTKFADIRITFQACKHARGHIYKYAVTYPPAIIKASSMNAIDIKYRVVRCVQKHRMLTCSRAGAELRLAPSRADATSEEMRTVLAACAKLLTELRAQQAGAVVVTSLWTAAGHILLPQCLLVLSSSCNDLQHAGRSFEETRSAAFPGPFAHNRTESPLANRQGSSCSFLPFMTYAPLKEFPFQHQQYGWS